ncbi:TNT domain-containing protein [Streptomyces sp. bgisy032]|uniref:TNT domain-containing protein n=1 Tax=Streptomyces sp. bgisy032 TaxID=3413773 RepID=UPI003D70E968
MRSPRRRAGLAAAFGLAGSLVMGASVPSAATEAGDGGRPDAPEHVRTGTPALPSAEPPAATGDDHGRPRACKGLVPYPIPEAYRSYFFCGDWRLGPRHLPSHGLLGNILRGYDRLGGLSAVRFLDKWWNPALDSGQGDWKYPPDDGFARNAQGGVIAAPLLLRAGQNVMLDRFGNEAGRFLAAAGTKYGKRSIPPSSLNPSDPRYPYNYHLYRLAKDVTVCAGPAAPAFEQPGGAPQYVTSSSFCPSIPRTTVGDLVNNGTLVRVRVPAQHEKHDAHGKHHTPATEGLRALTR